MTTLFSRKQSKILDLLSPGTPLSQSLGTLYRNYLKRHAERASLPSVGKDSPEPVGFFEIWENAGGSTLLQAVEKGRFETVRLFLDSNIINISFNERIVNFDISSYRRNIVIDNKMALKILFRHQRNRIYNWIATAARSESENEAKEIMLCVNLLQAEYDIQSVGLNSLELRSKLVDAFKKYLNEQEVKAGFEREALRSLVSGLVPKELLQRNPTLLAKLELRLVDSVISNVITIRTCEVLNKSRNDRASFTDLMPLVFNYVDGSPLTSALLLSESAQQVRATNSTNSSLIPAGAAAASVDAVAEELRTRVNTPS